MVNTNSILSVAAALVTPVFFAGILLLKPDAPPWKLFIACALLGPLTAAFFGHAALREIRKSGQPKPWASAIARIGLTAGYLEIVLPSLLLFSNLPHPYRGVAFESAAVGSLRSMNFAARAYAGTHPKEGFPRELADLSRKNSQSEPDWSIDQELAGGAKNHYRFTYAAQRTKREGTLDAYQIHADPIDSKDQAFRHFFTDQTGSIRVSIGSPANESSAEIN